jgi:hypothetical protein
MIRGKAGILFIAACALLVSVARAQSPQQVIQQAVDAEHAADRNDHSLWLYLEESRKPKERLLQWVASTGQGNVSRVLDKDGQKLLDSQQRDLMQSFLHDPGARKKQLSENNHDNQQIDDLLELLPVAFRWTQTGSTTTAIFLHFEPAPGFRPPTREARVFGSMVGDVIVDRAQHRVRSMNGRLIRDVTFGGGLLGRLKQGSSFSLDQEQVGPSLWQLTEFHIRLDGNALLFKSVSLQQDDQRKDFQQEPSGITLDQAASAAMRQPEVAEEQQDSGRH